MSENNTPKETILGPPEVILTRPRKPGMPISLTEEKAQLICKAIRQGAYIETACAYANVPRKTFYDWMKRGRMEDGSIFSNFVEAIDEALATAQMLDLEVITKAATGGDWRAAAWRLERRNPREWGAKKIVELKSDKDDSVTYVVMGSTKVDNEEDWAERAAEEAARTLIERKKKLEQEIKEPILKQDEPTTTIENEEIVKAQKETQPKISFEPPSQGWPLKNDKGWPPK